MTKPKKTVKPKTKPAKPKAKAAKSKKTPKVGVTGWIHAKHHAEVLKSAKRVGLDQIDDVIYSLSKVGAKVASEYGYPDETLIFGGCWITLVGNKDFAWILANRTFGFDWWKTSPVLSCKKVRGGYDLETQNSFYKLRKTKEK